MAAATSTPPTPNPPQRPKHLKRDSTHLLSTPASPSDELSPLAKRLRVAFSDDIDVRILQDEWGTTARPQDLVVEEVRIAIEGHRRRGARAEEDEAYETLRGLFLSAGLEEALGSRGMGRRMEISDGRPSAGLLRQYLVALMRRVGELKGCSTLVFAVLDVNWFGRDEKFVSVYMKFLGALGSVVPGFLRPIMEKIVRHFVSLSPSHGRIPGEPIVRKRQMLANLHGALRYLTSLIPTASNALKDALQSQFPNHRMTNQKDYLAYIRNMFRTSTYAPELRSDILTLITERLVKIDVEIQEELEDLDEDVEEELVEGEVKKDNYFLDDDTSDESDAESDASSDLDDTPEDRQVRDLREKTSKLDAGMDFLFTHYSTLITADHTTDTFEPLLTLFTTFVLPTYRSRHLQFLTFHFALLDTEKTARFVSRCLTLITTGSASSHTPVFAAAYLASFLARGARIPRPMIRDVVAVLIQRINDLRPIYENAPRSAPDIGRFAPFYAAFQALLYVFCFRWREVLFNAGADVSDDDLDYDLLGDAQAVPGLKRCIADAVQGKLNPLKVCAPAIVKQFVAIARHLNYLYLYAKLETNKRVRLSSYRTYGGGEGLVKRDSALSGKSGEGHHQLDAFFPFDPYRLPRSKRWLEGDYNEWRGIEGMSYDPGEDAGRRESDVEGDDGESEEEDDDEDVEGDLDSDSS